MAQDLVVAACHGSRTRHQTPRALRAFQLVVLACPQLLLALLCAEEGGTGRTGATAAHEDGALANVGPHPGHMDAWMLDL